MTIVGALLGSYRITDELKSGGMGTVYRARHELLGRPAAVKLLRPDLTEKPDLVQRFFNEARAATAIRHPGIIEVFDFGYADDGRAYLVMEFLEGQSLGDRRRILGRLPEYEAAKIGRGIASALTAAHAKNIVHRDLKPDNIFLVPDQELGERPKVLDFGIAKLVDPSGMPLGNTRTATGTLIGTPRYMAPEQARAASEIDHRADLYSLGCILYELVVGEAPFATGGSGEVIAQHLFGEVVPPSARGIVIAPAMEALIMRLLQKEPADRFQSAAELGDELARIYNLPVLRPPLPIASETSASLSVLLESMAVAPSTIEDPPPRRHSALAIIAAILTVLVAGALVFWIVTATRNDAAPAPTPAPPVSARPAERALPAPRASSPPTQAPVEAPHPPVKPVTPRTPQKPPPCDGHKGEHTGKCSPIDVTPL